MNFAGIMIFGIVVSLTSLLFKTIKSEYSMYIIIGAVLIIFMFVITQMEAVIDTVREIKVYINFEDAYVNTLIKIIGISYLTQFSADICKDCGYQSLSNQLLVFGKISVLAISMPVVLSLLETINQVLL